MEAQTLDYFSNLYLYYYYGSYTRCEENWKEYHVSCPFNKLYYIRKGECELVIDGTVYHAIPGECYLIPAHTRHSYYQISDNHVEKYWMHFDLRTGEEQILKKLKLPFRVEIPEKQGEQTVMEENFQRLFALSREHSPASRMQEKAQILLLVSEFMRYAQKAEAAERTGRTGVTGRNGMADRILSADDCNSRLPGVVDYMNTHLSQKITVEELAALLHIHPNYFIRMFKSHMGVPPLNYMNRLRVERAKSLLENTKLPISQVMTQVGFEELSSFSGFFKHYTGYNPRDFRKYYQISDSHSGQNGK